jgi:hypothetical protein
LRVWLIKDYDSLTSNATSSSAAVPAMGSNA